MYRVIVRFLPTIFLSLTVSGLLLLAGCGSSSQTPTVTLSGTVTAIDQGQSVTISATTANDGGDGVTWSVTGGGTLGSSTTTSVIYTAPTTVTGATTVTITATSIKSGTVTSNFTVTVYPAPAITTTAGTLSSGGGGQVGSTYTFTVTSSGGVSPYTWSVLNGALPAGLSLNASTGVISGTPTVSGSYVFTLQMKDSGSPADTATLAGTINIAAAPAIVFSAPTLPAATVGSTYAGSVAASGGAGAITYSIASGSLPAGFTLNANGAITGSLTTPLPTAPAISTFAVKATDAFADTATSATYTITAQYPTLAITTATLPSGIVGATYPTTTLAATGGNGTYTNWSVVPSNALSQYGLALNAATGAITGTPANVTSATTDTFTAKLTDSYGDTATSANLSITLYPALSFSTALTLPNGEVGTAYSGSISATGGSGSGYTYAVTAGTAFSAAGLTLNPTGTITGTPGTGQSESAATATVKVTDGAGNSTTQTFTLTVYAGLAITTTTLPSGIQGSAYSPQTLIAAGGSGNYTWSITNNAAALSSVGLQLSPTTGVISLTGASLTGAESAATFTVQVKDSTTNLTASQTFSLTVYGALSITTPTTLPNGLVGTAYTPVTLAATGGSGGYTFSYVSGAALSTAGLTLAGGLISGTPGTAESAATVTIKVTDSNGDTAQSTFSLTVYAALSFTTPATLSPGDQGTAYTATIAATGGSGSGYTYTVTGGSGLAGLTFTNGAITGSPTSTETAGSFTVKVTDGAGNTFSQNFFLTVYSPLSFVTGTLPNGIIGTAYSGSLPAATGGSGTYSYAVTTGSGLSAANLGLVGTTNVISGTPQSGETETAAAFSVKVTDTNVPAATVTTPFAMTVYPAFTVTSTTLPYAIVNGTYSGSLTATGGSGTYTNYAVTPSNALSQYGLTLNAATGAITGTAANVTATTNDTFSLQVTDSAGDKTTANVSLTLYPALTITTTSLPSGSVGVAYTATPIATGGSGTYTNWSITSGSGCLTTAGLTGFNATTGTIFGNTPSAATCSVVLKVTDSLGNTASTGNLALNIYTGITITTPTTLPAGIVGGVYSPVTLAAAGGTGTGYTFTYVSGTALSTAGLTLNNGVISGTPTAAESAATVTIKVTDSANNTTQSTFSLTIYGALSITTPTTLPTGINGTAYLQSLASTGGSGGYTYTVTGGTALSAVGLQLSSSGVISPIATNITNTETAATVTIKVTDSNSDTASSTFTLTVNPALSVTTTTVPNGTIGSSYTTTLQASGGTGTGYTWSFVSGQTALAAAGLSLNTSAGVLSATTLTTPPLTNSAFVVQVKDSSNNTAQSGTLLLTTTYATPIINPAPSSNLTGTVNSNFSQTFTAIDGSGNYTWAVTSGASALTTLGLTFNTATATLSGTPNATTAGLQFTVMVTDTTSNLTSSATYTLVVASAAPTQCTNSGANNAILNGHYAFLLAGYDPNGHKFDSIGEFQADGAYRITNGDAESLGDQNSTYFNSTTTGNAIEYTFTGTYSIGNSTSDTRGMMSLTNSFSSLNGLPANTSYCFAADTISGGVAKTGRIIEADGSGFVLSGSFEMQDTANFTQTAEQGSFAFGVQGVNGTTPNRKAAIGQFVINSTGGMSSGQIDYAGYSSGATTYTAAVAVSSGGYGVTAPGSSGRGELTMEAGGTELEFYTYVSGNNKLLMLSYNNNLEPMLSGQAIQQTTTTYTTSNIAGSGIFRSTGSDATNFTPAADFVQVGQGTFDGAGNFTGQLDSNDGGNVDSSNGTTNGIPNPQTLSGLTYTVSSIGYVTLAGGGSHTPNFYLYAPGSGFGLDSQNSVDLYYLAAQTLPSGGFTTSNIDADYTGSYAIGAIPPQAYNSSNGYPAVFDSAVTLNTSQTPSLINGFVDSIYAPGLAANLSVDIPYTNTVALDSTYGANTGRVIIEQGGGLNSIGYLVSPTTFFLMGAQSGQDGFIAQADQITSAVNNTNNGLAITTTSISSGTQGNYYSAQLTASGGTGSSYTWTVISGSGLSNTGLSLSTSGLITGTPTTAENNASFTVQVEDSGSNIATITLYLTVVASGGSGNTVNGSISIPNSCGVSQLPIMQVSINTSPVQTANVTGSGNFSFSNVPSGSYIITPSISGAEAVFLPATQTVTVSSSTPYINFTANIGYTVSGTVTNSSGKTGQIYLLLDSTNCGNSGTQGTSLSTAGNFTIHGVPPGAFTLQAFMDTLGDGASNASDPVGANSNVNVTNANLTGVDVTLAAPAAVTLTSAPGIQSVNPMNNAVLVSYQSVSNNSVEQATSYTLQWSDTAGGAIIGSQTFPATGSSGTNIWLANTATASPACNNCASLASGSYYFSAYASAGSSVGPTSTWTGPITMGAPTEADTVTGTVTYTGTATGPMYVGFYNTSTGNFYGDYIANPSSPQAYTVSLPSASTYFFVSVVDQNKDGVVDAGDFQNTSSNKTATTSITGSITGENLTLPSAFGTAAITTAHNRVLLTGSSPSDNYNLMFNVYGAIKLPVAVTLVSGPNAVVPMDIATCNAANTGCNGDGFQIQQYLSTVSPNAGDTYTFDVTYSDGTTGTVTASVSTVLNAFATNLLPQDGVSPVSTSLTPTFTWTDPAGSYTYQFSISPQYSNTIWQVPGNNSNTGTFSSSYTSITYGSAAPPNSSGNSPSAALSTGTIYQWTITTVDSNNNTASVQVQYTP